MNLPKISIVTPSYNQGQFLEETILSVLNQNYPNIEYMIIDGGSTDNSVDIIKKYEDHLAYWVSEKDQGQTHAINKGFKQSTGEILNWLNSDDLLAPGAVRGVAEGFIKNPEADFWFGDITIIDSEGQAIFSRKSAPYRFRTLFYGRQLGSQPTVFFRRHVLEQIGYLNEAMTFCMDTEFWMRAATHGMTFHHLKRPLARARMHKQAKTVRLQKVLHEEHKAIVRRYCQWRFREGSLLENTYYTILNRWWRFIAAFNRCIYRGDWTFGRTGNALRSIQRTGGSTRSTLETDRRKMMKIEGRILHCKACGNHSVTPKYEMDEWKVWGCNDCGFVFAYPLKGIVLDSSIDDPYTVETHHLYREELMLSAGTRVKELTEFLGDLDGLKVLDVGCGNGYFLQCCKEQGMTVQGLEINEAAARYAQSELGIPIPVVAIPPPYDKAFDIKSFDVITLWGVIEHLDDPGKVVSSLRKFLKDEGTFVLQTPTEDALVRRMIHAWNKIMHKKSFVGSMYSNQRGAHIQCFSRRSVREFLTRRGFKVLKIKDSTYGKKYMLKKPIFMRDTLSSKALRVGAGFLYDSTRIIGHQNHMLVFAGMVDQESV